MRVETLSQDLAYEKHSNIKARPQAPGMLSGPTTQDSSPGYSCAGVWTHALLVGLSKAMLWHSFVHLCD